MPSRVLGIIVGGGPAPGINGVIGAATINAINHGFEVRGFYDGFKWLTKPDFDPLTQSVVLRIPDVARIHFEGGSILRTSRTSLLSKNSAREGIRINSDEQKVATVLKNLRSLGVTHVITIGGDDTALSARFVAEAAGGSLRVVHVPKTIDNDLPLPSDLPTFGYNTARHYGAELVANLMEDSRTTGRWYFVVAMGRNAGFLALGIGKSAGATLTLIPEEFPEHTTVARIVDVLEGAILKRLAMGRPDGVAVIAEGLAYKLGDVEELAQILGKEVPVDAAGHPRLAEFPLDEILKREVLRRFQERNESITIVSETLGYELRCARPTPFDMAYCKDLGHGAVTLLLEDERSRSGLMVAIHSGDLLPVPFESMIDPVTNRTQVRYVDLQSTPYLVARSYMIRLEHGDFASAQSLARIAAQGKMTPEQFVKRYKPMVDESVVKLPPSMAHSQVVQVVDEPIESHRVATTTDLLPM
jgi:6-phosphofructokinase 1